MFESLTPRETEILGLIAQGLSNNEIAERLVLSLGTVKVHSHNIYGKLGVSSRVQAVNAAEALGLVPARSNREHVLGPIRSAVSVGVTVVQGHFTPIVGRESDLERLANLVADERVRLITVLGPGGMGKTRLVIELLQRVQHGFRDGAYLISLVNVSDPSAVPEIILEGLGARAKPTEDATLTLINYLRDRHVLLALDMFEYVLPAAEAIGAVLQRAPRVTIICTSRERLNLSVEVVWTLGGLDAAVEDAGRIVESSAARLLIDRAQMVVPGFAPMDADRNAIAEICRLTGGMPLAIILAAGWLNLLGLEEVASELAKGLDILSGHLRDLPERQRSMRATLALSWERLEAGEQAVLKGLSVFTGGATREAAQQVSGASIFNLKALADRSFVAVSNERVEMHEVIRQFVLDVLRADDSQYQLTLERHAQYFASYLEARAHSIYSDPAIVRAIRRDIANIQAAWSWAVRQRSLDLLLSMSVPMATYWHLQGKYGEGLHVFSSALADLTDMLPSTKRDLLIARLHTDVGWFSIRVGKLDAAEHHFGFACSALAQLGEPLHQWLTSPLIGPVFIRLVRAQYAEARDLASQLVRDEVFADDPFNDACVHYTLASAEVATGRLEQARHHAELAVALTNDSGDRWFRAYCLVELAQIARILGDLERSVEYAQASYAIREEFDDPEGMAIAILNLAAAAYQAGDLEAAYRHYSRCEALYRDVQDEGGYAAALHGLACVAFANDRHEDCVALLLRSMRIARRIGYVPLLFETIVTAGDVLVTDELIDFAIRHPACSQETRVRASHAERRFTSASLRRRTASDVSASEQSQQLRSEVDAVVRDLQSIGQNPQDNIPPH